MNMNFKQFKFVYLFAAVFFIAAGFYFWERYLLNHFLGGYDRFGLPAQQSATGFWFFMTAWPLWVFPLAVLGVFVGYWLGLKREKRTLVQNDLAAKLAEKEFECTQLHIHNQALEKASHAPLPDKNLSVDYRRLEKAYALLAKDYKQSLELIESLVDNVEIPLK